MVVEMETTTTQSTATVEQRLSALERYLQSIDAQLAATVTGHGSVSAVLAGTKLTVTGSFEDMRSAATAARLYMSKMTGVRSGVAIHDLTVSQAMGGNISGSVDLTAAEADALRKGLVYVQVDSVGAKDGNLRGWFLK